MMTVVMVRSMAMVEVEGWVNEENVVVGWVGVARAARVGEERWARVVGLWHCRFVVG